ncbi:MAG: hypothetical protein VX491_09345, partial [Pseudomonadota bacterium]|nr:hypothetical protein [Pseudomonadota bacterium]
FFSCQNICPIYQLYNLRAALKGQGNDSRNFYDPRKPRMVAAVCSRFRRQERVFHRLEHGRSRS